MKIEESWKPSVNAALSASAGAGKTYNLTARLIVILLKEINNDLRSVFAVTFTNKATLEMKEKLLKRLRGLANLNAMSAEDEKNEKIDELAGIVSGGDRNKLQELAGKAYDRLVANLSDLNVSTIHSFLSGIVSLFPFEIGIDPDTSVIDEAEAKYLQQLALDEFFEKAKNDEEHCRNIMDAYYELHTGSLDVRKIISGNMLEFLEKSCEIGNTFRSDELKKKLAEERRGFKKLESTFIAVMNKNLGEICRIIRKHEEENNSILSSLRNFESFLNRPNIRNFNKNVGEVLSKYETLEDHRLFKSFFKKIGGLDCIDTKQMEISYENIQKYFRNEFKALAESCNSIIVSAFLSLFLEYVSIYSEIKRREGCLDFSDLERHAFSLLSGDAFDTEYFYYRIDTRIKHLLIDEFQDTNVIQWKVLKPLVEEIVAGCGVHDSPGSFFYVGDKKQAIYRFRGGESGLFDLAMSEIRDVHPFLLDENRRSGYEIVEWVNRIFKEIMPEYQKQVPVPEGGYVELDLIEKKEGSNNNNDKLFCTRTSEIVKSLAERGLSYSNIAVLGRTKKHLTSIEEEFKKENIPYRSETSSRLLKAFEVSDVVNLLHFLNDPEDDIALASALKSPLFRLTAEKINIAAMHAGKTLYLKFKNSGKSDASEKLNNLLSEVGFLTPLSLLNRIYVEFSLPYLYADVPGASENLLRLLDESHVFQKEHNGDISCFLEYLKRRDEALTQEAAEGEGEGKVNILTVHKSKGLEYHTVIVPFADDEIKLYVKKTPFIFVNDENFSLKDIVKTPTKIEIDASQRLKEVFNDESAKVIKDELNLLYVALTRAKKNLYVLGSIKTASRDSSVNEKGELKDTWFNWMVKGLGLEASQLEGNGESFIPIYQSGKESLEGEDSGSKINSRKTKRLPELQFPSGEEYGQGDDISPSKPSNGEEHDFDWNEYHFSGRRKKQAMGELIHLALSRIGLLTQGADIESVVKDAVSFAMRGSTKLNGITGFSFDDISKEMCRSIKELLLDRELEGIFYTNRGRAAKLEAPVYSKSKGKDFVGGIMDRVIIEPDEIKVIDYKWTQSDWSKMSDSTIAEIIDRYRKQLDYYRKSLESIFSGKRVKSYLLLIGAPAGRRLVEV